MPFNIKDAIEEAYEMALEKVKGGMLYGEAIDLDNPKHVALSLYLIGLREGQNEAIRYLEVLSK